MTRLICKDIKKKFKDKVECTFDETDVSVKVKDSINYQELAQFSIQELSIYSKDPITHLPPELEMLKIYNDYNAPLPSELPLNLEILQIGNAFNQPLPKLPESLLLLKIGNGFNQPIELPSKLEILSLGTGFKHTIIKLPKTLKKLTIKGDYPYFLPLHKVNLNFVDVYGMQSKNQILSVLSEKICQKIKSIFKKSLECNIAKYGISVTINGDLDYKKLSKFPITSMQINSNQKITYLPKRLETLKIYDDFNETLPKNLPKNLFLLIIGNSFNQLLPTRLPDALETLILGNSFNHPLPVSLPASLETLIIGNSFNHHISTLPKKLQVLILGESFEQKLQDLPSTLIKLDIKSQTQYFEKKVNSSIQTNNLLEKVSSINQNMENIDECQKIIENFGVSSGIECMYQKLLVVIHTAVDFNKLASFHKIKEMQIIFSQPITVLPPNLETLKLGDEYDDIIYGLPNSLKKLEIGNSFNQKLPELPSGLSELSIGNNFEWDLPEVLPSSLNYLFVGDKFNNPLPNTLPDNLKVLFLGNSFNQELPLEFPKYMEELHLGDNFNYELIGTKLPETLKIIELGNSYEQKLPMTLPNDLEKLVIGLKWFGDLPSQLPPNLKTIKIYSVRFDSELPKLPDTLEKLSLGVIFDKPLPKVLPINLRVLDLKYKFSQKLPETLPDKLEKLCLGNSFNKILPKLSSSIQKVELLNKNYEFELNSIRELNVPIWFETVAFFNQRIPENISKLSIRTFNVVYDFEGDKLIKYLTFHNTLHDMKGKFDGKSIEELIRVGFLTYDYNQNLILINGQRLTYNIYKEILEKLQINENNSIRSNNMVSMNKSLFEKNSNTNKSLLKNNSNTNKSLFEPSSNTNNNLFERKSNNRNENQPKELPPFPNTYNNINFIELPLPPSNIQTQFKK